MFRLRGTALVVMVVGACSPSSQADRTLPGDASGDAASATHYTVSDFQRLRFLEGDWRGQGADTSRFYESYRFADDSTIDMTAWTDSTLTTAKERSQYMLRDGAIVTNSGGRLVSADSTGHHFQAPTYAWTFQSVSPDRWTARVSATTIYTMDRIARSPKTSP